MSQTVFIDDKFSVKAPPGILHFINMNTRPPISIHVSLLNDFFISEEVRKSLDSYYILHWQKSHLIGKLSLNGTLTHADVEYIPVFRMSLNNPDIEYVRLSFRKAKPYLGIPPYVLIKEAKQFRMQ